MKRKMRTYLLELLDLSLIEHLEGLGVGSLVRRFGLFLFMKKKWQKKEKIVQKLKVVSFRYSG